MELDLFKELFTLCAFWLKEEGFQPVGLKIYRFLDQEGFTNMTIQEIKAKFYKEVIRKDKLDSGRLICIK